MDKKIIFFFFHFLLNSYICNANILKMLLKIYIFLIAIYIKIIFYFIFIVISHFSYIVYFKQLDFNKNERRRFN